MRYTKIDFSGCLISAKWYDQFATGADIVFQSYITNKKVFFCCGHKVLESYSVPDGLKMYEPNYNDFYNNARKDFIYIFLPMLGTNLREKLIQLNYFKKIII